MSVNGVESVRVSLEKGLATVKFKPGNSATLKQLQNAITKNGFTMKESKIVASGSVVQEGGTLKLKVSGSNDVLTMIAEKPGVAMPSPGNSAVVVVEGTVPESPNGKTADSIRFHSFTEEKQ